MESLAKKPRFNRRLDNKLKNYAVRTLAELERTTGVDSEVKVALYSQIKDISNTLRGGEYLVFAPESRLIDAKKLESGLETYLQSQAKTSRLSAEQTEKVRSYASGLTSLLENHLQTLENKRIERQKAAERNAAYLDEVTFKAQKALKETYSKIGDETYIASINDRITSMNSIMKGEGTRQDAKGKTRKIRTYADRVSFIKSNALKIVREVDKGYSTGKISADQAREITAQTMKLLNNYSDADYFKRSRARVKEECAAKSHEMSLYTTVKELANVRNHFRNEVENAKLREAEEEKERIKAKEEEKKHFKRVNGIFNEFRNITLDNLARSTREAAEQYSRNYAAKVAEKYTGFKGTLQYIRDISVNFFSRVIEPNLSHMRTNLF